MAEMDFNHRIKAEEIATLRVNFSMSEVTWFDFSAGVRCECGDVVTVADAGAMRDADAVGTCRLCGRVYRLVLFAGESNP